MMDNLQLLITYLQQHPLAFVSAIFVVSLCVGSFLNVVIYRLPLMMENAFAQEYQEYFHPKDAQLSAEPFNLAVPRSACPKCHHQLAVKDNIPLVGWLLLGGKCRYCQTAISKRYPLVELTTALLSAVVAYHFGATGFGFLAIVTTWCLIALTGTDIDKMLLPDEITLPLLWLVLTATLFGVGQSSGDAILGAAIGYLSLWSVYWGFKLLTGKEGMGYGDFKLMAIFGALLGWQQLPLVILLSAVVGAVVGSLLLLASNKGQDTKIPYGPYIIGAGFIALLWGEQINNAYLGYVLN
jgi:leader peptidase (prepilin peptidase)/N-methyltransferase